MRLLVTPANQGFGFLDQCIDLFYLIFLLKSNESIMELAQIVVGHFTAKPTFITTSPATLSNSSQMLHPIAQCSLSNPKLMLPYCKPRNTFMIPSVSSCNRSVLFIMFLSYSSSKSTIEVFSRSKDKSSHAPYQTISFHKPCEARMLGYDKKRLPLLRDDNSDVRMERAPASLDEGCMRMCPPSCSGMPIVAHWQSWNCSLSFSPAHRLPGCVVGL